jgi:hypothetical protein
MVGTGRDDAPCRHAGQSGECPPARPSLPSLQLALGIWWFGEPFDAERLIGFGLIWTALAVYSVEGLIRQRAPALPR